MLIHFKNLLKIWFNKGLTGFVLMEISIMLSLFSFFGLAELVDQDLATSFPILWTLFTLANGFLITLLIASFISYLKEKNGDDYLNLLIGSFVAVSLQIIIATSVYTIESAAKHSIPADRMLTIMTVIPIVVPFLVNLFFHLENQSKRFQPTQKEMIMAEEETEENTPVVAEESTVSLKTYSECKDDNIQKNMHTLQNLHSYIRKHTLSVEEQHTVSRSLQDIHHAMDTYVELQIQSQEQIKPTLLSVLEHAKRNLQTIVNKKETEKMGEIERILSVQQQKTTY